MNNTEVRHPNKIKMLRMQREEFWKLKDFAAATGISRAMLIKYEKGESFPMLPNLKKILSTLNVEFDEVYPKNNNTNESTDNITPAENIIPN